MENVFNFQLSKLVSNLVNEKLDQIFEKLNCAAKVNVALGFVLRNIEYVFFMSVEITIFAGFFDKYPLLCAKADLTTIQNKVSQQDLIEVCTQERQKLKMAIQVDHNCDHFCCLTQKRTHGMSRFSDSRTTSEQ